MPRSVQYVIEPNGEVEFYGATNEVRFEPGEIEKTVNILAKGDGIPEVSVYSCYYSQIGHYSHLSNTVTSQLMPHTQVMYTPVGFGELILQIRSPLHPGHLPSSQDGLNRKVPLYYLHTWSPVSRSLVQFT